jgi:alkylation response protein AidB-like acyl-CoA dehydrogenase
MSLAADLLELVPWMQSRAEALDRDAGFPGEEMDRLWRIGALTLPLPVRSGPRQGEVRDDRIADQMSEVLTLAGRGNLSVGRILEAHINALHLIGRYGTAEQWQEAMRDAQEGHLFALWVTDPPAGGLRMRMSGRAIRLTGAKQFCSGAGHATRGVVTAEDTNGSARMLVLRLQSGERVSGLVSPLQGMRAAVTGAVDFTGCEATADRRLGQAGDYLREPDLSAGAWRGSAVALGGLIALLDLTIDQLRLSGRLESPHAQTRMGLALIARESSRMWVRQAARTAEDPTERSGHRVAAVGLARIAVETACLDAIRLVQRSLGLSAFRQGNPLERICRDLSTYLRQPAPDEVLTEAACWFAANPDTSVAE